MFNTKIKKSLMTVIISMTLGLSLLCSCGNTNTTATGNAEANNNLTTETTENEDLTSNSAENVTSDSADTVTTNDESQTSENSSAELLTGKHHVEISVKDYGTISLELDADVAPISVTNFVNLSNSGFYDGLTFHRIISGFMIQGGDPLGNGTGGADINIKGEFDANGVTNSISHVRGAISMARSNDYDSASSQFFIVHEDSQFLDGQYAAFGMVTEGIEIVDQICDATPVLDDNGTVAPENQPIIESIKVID